MRYIQVRYGFELSEDVTIPSGSELRFVGGKIANSVANNYAISGNGVIIESQDKTVFDKVSVTNVGNQTIKALWFGIVTDNNSVDNHDALLRAVSCAYTSCGIVELPSGTIYTSCISLYGYRHLTIIGADIKYGNSGSKLVALSSANNYSLLQFCDANMTQYSLPWTCDHATVKNLILDGNNIADNCVSGNYNLTVENCDIQGATVAGIKLENYTYPVYIRDCVIHGNKNGVISDGPNTTIFNIDDCKIGSNTESGLIIYNGYNVVVRNGDFESNGKEAIKIIRKNGALQTLGNIYFYNVYCEDNGANSDYSILIDSETRSFNASEMPYGIKFIGGMCAAKVGIMNASLVEIGFDFVYESYIEENPDKRYISNVYYTFYNPRRNEYTGNVFVATWENGTMNLYNLDNFKSHVSAAVGVAVYDNGHMFIVAKNTSTLVWSTENISGGITPIESKAPLVQSFDGESKTSTIITTLTAQKALAANYCAEYYPSNVLQSDNAFGAGKWFMPAAGQVLTIMAHVKEINYLLSKIDGQPIAGDMWSCDEYNATLAWRINPIDGNMFMMTKNVAFPVRPITNIH